MREQRLYRQVVEQILELIDSGKYPVGSKLPPERELAERFGVSRPTVREAVIALEAIERIRVKTGSGMYVSEKTSEGQLGSNISPFELMETRVLIEGEAAALAATMITKDQLHRLQEILEEMAQENTLDGLGADRADSNFHAIIAEATNNRMLESLIKHLWETQEKIENIKGAHMEMCMPDAGSRLKEHRAIYEALAKGDSQAARIAMRQHFSRIINALHATVEKEAVEAVRRKLSQTRERFSAGRIVS